MRAERRMVTLLLGVVIAGWLLWLLEGVLLPFVAGMLVAYFLDPVADKLEAWGCSRTVATGLITAGFVLALILLLLLFIPLLHVQVLGLMTRMPGYIDALREHGAPFIERLQAHISDEQIERMRAFASQYVGEALQWVGELFKKIVQGGVAIFQVLSLVVITPLVAFYLLRDWDLIVARLDKLLPRDMAPTIRIIITDIDKTIAAFVRGQGLVCLILGLFYAVGLTVVGLDFGLVVGLGAGFISFVPYLGSMLGLVVSVGIAFAQFPDILNVAIVAGVFFAGQMIEGNFLTPKIVGESVGLHPVWVIFALLAGGALFGFTGMLLAVPVAAAIGVLVRFWTDRYLNSHLYHGDGAPEE